MSGKPNISKPMVGIADHIFLTGAKSKGDYFKIWLIKSRPRNSMKDTIFI